MEALEHIPLCYPCLCLQAINARNIVVAVWYNPFCEQNRETDETHHVSRLSQFQSQATAVPNAKRGADVQVRICSGWVSPDPRRRRFPNVDVTPVCFPKRLYYRQTEKFTLNEPLGQEGGMCFSLWARVARQPTPSVFQALKMNAASKRHRLLLLKTFPCEKSFYVFHFQVTCFSRFSRTPEKNETPSFKASRFTFRRGATFSPLCCSFFNAMERVLKNVTSTLCRGMREKLLKGSFLLEVKFTSKATLLFDVPERCLQQQL